MSISNGKEMKQKSKNFASNQRSVVEADIRDIEGILAVQGENLLANKKGDIAKAGTEGFLIYALIADLFKWKQNLSSGDNLYQKKLNFGVITVSPRRSLLLLVLTVSFLAITNSYHPDTIAQIHALLASGVIKTPFR